MKATRFTADWLSPLRWQLIFSLCFCLVWLFLSDEAQAGALADRVATFPHWHKPLVQVATDDLVYPPWLAGTWNVTSTLVDLVAPLAPKIVTPGFDNNRQYLNQPISFQVRFVEQSLSDRSSVLGRLTKGLGSQTAHANRIVADRAFNGLNLARAYLGNSPQSPVLSVKVDPNSPNRQITRLRGDRQLISIVTGRAIETPAPDQFITTELFQQSFRGTSIPYFNQVETTTAFQRWSGASPTIQADQITAIYLSPQDPDYFKAGNSPLRGLGSSSLKNLLDRPVALYRYRLEFIEPMPLLPDH